MNSLAGRAGFSIWHQPACQPIKPFSSRPITRSIAMPPVDESNTPPDYRRVPNACTSAPKRPRSCHPLTHPHPLPTLNKINAKKGKDRAKACQTESHSGRQRARSYDPSHCSPSISFGGFAHASCPMAFPAGCGEIDRSAVTLIDAMPKESLDVGR
jgi:hypothetical protein